MEFEDLNSIILRNKFMPMPPAKRIFTGNDGDLEDFRLQGCNILRSLVTNGLKPEHRVLDIGSGIGRAALPLTFFLTTGEYVGIDIVLDGVSWCREHISTRYENFVFLHSDVNNDYYNPMGVHKVKDIRLPFEDGHFDFIFLASVFTHLLVEDSESYLDSISRLLKTGGRLWSTWFLVNDEVRSTIRSGKAAFSYVLDEGPDYFLPGRTTVSVGYDEGHVMQQLEKRALKPISLDRGNWSAAYQSGGFQDMVVAEKV